jgi:predicted ATPase
LLTNYRPEYRHEWGQKTYYTQLRLAPFGKAEAEEFLDSLLSDIGSPLPRRERPVLSKVEGDRERVTENNLHALKQLILDKTQGTPFFMEEIVQELREQGVLTRDDVGARRAVPLPTDLHIPPTVQGVLAARIDRLTPDEKALLQQLAVIRREFPVSLVRRVVSQPEEELYRLLSSLQHKEFLYEQPAFPEPEYLFKHALTQEVAYNSVLIERRKALHEQTAQALETLYSANLEDHYSELAHHYSRSGNTEKAVQYLQLAGQQAAQQSANAEAITYITTALELLKTLPDTPEPAQQELTLLTTLGPALMATKSPAVRELEQIYTRAQELCQRVGDMSQLFPVLSGLYVFHLVRGAFHTAHELAEQFLRLTQRTQASEFFPLAYKSVGETLFFLGEFSTARRHLEQGIACYTPKQHHSQAFFYGVADPGVFCLTEGAHILWLLGYPDQARQRSQEALTLARELSHPMSVAFALMHGAWIHVFLREEQAVHERAEMLIQLCTDQGFPNLLAHGAIEQGWALAKRREREKGVAQIRQGLAALQALDVEIGRPTYLAWLAEACQREGRVEEGLRTLDEALEEVGRTEERWYEAELYRLKGELTLQKFQVSSSKFQVPPNPQAEVEREAEACFLKAIEVARQQQAKSWELRATMSLVRLRQQQAVEQGARSKEQGARTTQHETRAKLAEARRMLSEIYHWFAEGFDTKDLQEAKALLESLSP